MALTTCSDCGSRVSDTARVCMQCGARVYPLDNIKFSRGFGWCAIAIAVVGFSYMFYDPTGYATQAPAAPVFKTVAQRKDIIAKATEGLQASVPHQGRTHYGVAVPEQRSSALGAYLAINDGQGPTVFVEPAYVGARPISFKSVNVTVNGVMAYKKAVNPKRIARATVKASSIESVDFQADAIELEILRRVVASETAVITFHGKGKPREHIITREQVAQLKTVVDAYDKLKAAL